MGESGKKHQKIIKYDEIPAHARKILFNVCMCYSRCKGKTENQQPMQVRCICLGHLGGQQQNLRGQL